MGVAALLSKLGEKSRTSLILVSNYGTYNLEVRLSLYIEMHTQTWQLLEYLIVIFLQRWMPP